MTTLSNPSNHSLATSQAHILIEIEQLVQTIAITDTRPNTNQWYLYPEPTFEDDFYQKIIDSLPRYLSVFSFLHQYSEHIHIFWEGCFNAGILFTHSDLGSSDVAIGTITPSQTRSLVATIAEQARTPQFNRRRNDRRFEATQKQLKISAYTQRIHEKYARVLGIRVDVSYRMDLQAEISIDSVYRHLRALLNMRTNNPVFNQCIGYAWVLEQGETRGYHAHLIFYFLGSRRQADWTIAKSIGELWVIITNGLGSYYNCHDDKEKFEGLGTLGIGMIHRNDPVACQNAINVANYLAKPDKKDQYLRMRPLNNRTFATGQLTW